MVLGWTLLCAAWLTHMALAGGGWLLRGLPPVAGARGFLLVVTWLIVALSVGLSLRCRQRERVAGSASVLAALLVGLAALLPVKVGELPQALRSPWFPVHVSLTAVGEAAMGVGFLAALLGLMRRGRAEGERVVLLLFCTAGGLLAGSVIQGALLRAGAYGDISGADLTLRVVLGTVACGAPFLLVLWMTSGRLAARAPAEGDLLELQLKSARLAYAFFSLGAVAAGMAWARAAWGSWWSWDPKEVASLVVWLMLTLHLHVGARYGWRSTGNRLLLVAAFLASLANLVGTFVLGGLHAYG
jgi:ABC-type transport system involved in cytochrome c biogenesis permease subunit